MSATWVERQLSRRQRHLAMLAARRAAGEPFTEAEVAEASAMGKSIRANLKSFEPSVVGRDTRASLYVLKRYLEGQDEAECQLRECAVPTPEPTPVKRAPSRPRAKAPSRPLTMKARPYQDRFAESGLWGAIGRRQSILSWIGAKVARGELPTRQERHNAGIAREALDTDASKVTLDAEWQARLDKELAKLDAEEAELAVALGAKR